MTSLKLVSTLSFCGRQSSGFDVSEMTANMGSNIAMATSLALGKGTQEQFLFLGCRLVVDKH